MKRTVFAGMTLTIILAACGSGRQFTTRDVETNKVKTIAVLPVQVNYTGTVPAKFTPAMLDSMKLQQGLSFQRALQANLLRYSGGRSKIQGVSFQSADKTNGLLEKNSLDARDIVNKDPDELARLLQVDAVVKMNVTSNRLMSDLASLGLGTLRNILFFSTTTSPTLSSSIQNKTADVYADCALLKDGRTLWTANYDRATDWNTSVNEVIDNITKKMGKGFPY
jgi:hypothetical protein